MDVSEALSYIICAGVRCDEDGCECQTEGRNCVYNELETRKLVEIARRRFTIRKRKYCDDVPYICQLNEAMAIIDKEFPAKARVV